MKKIVPFLLSAIGVNSACANPGYENLSANEFSQLIGKPNVVILDVRTPEEYTEGHIAEALNVDVTAPDFLAKTKSLIPSEKEVAVYCRSGRRSAEAAKILTDNGYKVANLTGGILEWEKEGRPVTQQPGDLDIFTTKDGKKVEIEPLIHASIRIVYDGKEIEIDPVGELNGRKTDYASFPKADFILITHEHHDHLDPNAIKTLEKPSTEVIVNQRVHDILGFGTVMANGDTLNFADNIEIQAVPAYNTSPDRLQFHPRGRDNGYVLTLDGLRIYVAGDTEVTPEMSELKDIDIAFLPCNLPYTMTPEQLVEAAEIIKPKVLYPYHYGTTDLSPVVEALKNSGIEVRVRPFD